MMGLLTLYKETEKAYSFSLSAMCGHSKKVVAWKPGREPSPEVDHAGSLLSDFQGSGLWEINICCLSYPVHGLLAQAALTDKDTQCDTPNDRLIPHVSTISPSTKDFSKLSWNLPPHSCQACEASGIRVIEGWESQFALLFFRLKAGLALSYPKTTTPQGGTSQPFLWNNSTFLLWT